MAQTNESLMSVINDYILEVKKHMSIDHVFLYGSYAKGAATCDSDVDLCFFSESFESRRSVDVVTDLLGIAGTFKDFNVEPRALPTSALSSGKPFIKEVLETGKRLA